MEVKTSVKISRVLKILVTITFVCNILALVLLPILVWGGVWGLVANPADVMGFYAFWLMLLGLGNGYALILTLFLFICGICTAVILWQGRRVLDTILKETPFCLENGGNMRRAAVASFVISAVALLRVGWGCWYFGSTQPLFTYCALFVPVFAMAGLLCMVMSALFRSAAELKAENDLTI